MIPPESRNLGEHGTPRRPLHITAVPRLFRLEGEGCPMETPETIGHRPDQRREKAKRLRPRLPVF